MTVRRGAHPAPCAGEGGFETRPYVHPAANVQPPVIINYQLS
jgi:hypothetical protein